ncbi:CopG domain protein DNA-binding domain protein [Gloeothece citriformis PCC 7424]|uniref:CopG domain protein DNA-binding domain protein n=1 Tax=Gloeothece citriformis (strain PCC 7424) TaxID=65393 RepID=B7KHC8_GLOC7|nr:ribbon-helix-helix protein, CopG family [Gloeothece citriformis]ACK69337.1 CopG domain protein DNA-binding domain protein [Gloeothece citriformis PCC 7424]
MTQKNDQLLGATVPQEWIDKFEQLAKQTNRPVSDLVREALAQYIGIDENSSRIISQLEQFKEDLQLLRQRVTETELYKTQIRDLLLRLAVVEQSLSKGQTSVMSPNVNLFSQAKLKEETENYEDDIEDEPDEILTDFIS